MYSSPEPVDSTPASDQDHAEMGALLANGWQHIGHDIWLAPDNDTPTTRASALRGVGRTAPNGRT